MNYIKDIRKKIGHDMLILAGAGVLPYRDGKLLLQQRQDNGCWAMHGGCKELGESPEQAAARELFEETGLTANSLMLFGVYSGIDYRHTYPNGDQVEIVNIVYTCDDFSGELHPQLEEVKALQWFDIDDLPENLSPPDAAPILAFAAHINSAQR